MSDVASLLPSQGVPESAILPRRENHGRKRRPFLFVAGTNYLFFFLVGVCVVFFSSCVFFCT